VVGSTTMIGPTVSACGVVGVAEPVGPAGVRVGDGGELDGVGRADGGGPSDRLARDPDGSPDGVGRWDGDQSVSAPSAGVLGRADRSLSGRGLARLSVGIGGRGVIGEGSLAGGDVGRAAGGRTLGRGSGTDDDGGFGTAAGLRVTDDGGLGTAAGLRVADDEGSGAGLRVADDGGVGRAVGGGRRDGGAASGRDGALGAGITSGTDGSPSAYPADQARTAAR
jgi:hypothetical protein